MDFYGLIGTILTIVISGSVGWVFGDKVNQAKMYNLFVKPFTKKEKMVARLSGEENDERDFLANRPLGEEPLIIKNGKQMITKYPLPRLNKSKKGVIVAEFDNRSFFQLPLETSHLVATLVVNEENKLVAKQLIENPRVAEAQPSSQAAQNLLINSIEWAKGQAKGEINQDFKKLKTLMYIIAFVSVVGLVVGILNAKFGSDILNLSGQVHNGLGNLAAVANATIYPAS